MIHYIDEVQDLKGKRVLLRLDLNVPVTDGVVESSFRLEKIIDTVDFFRHKGAETIIIAHCEGKDSATLVPMWKYLNGYFPVEFSPTYFTPEAIGKVTDMKPGSVLLFENVRINAGEKANDEAFAKQLAGMADIYVNDAFSVSHRTHASIVGVPKFLPHYGGLLLRKEIEGLSKAFSPEHPFLFILGGAKFDTKLPLVKKYLGKADTVCVTGALANDFFQLKGYELGTSLIDQGDFGLESLLSNEKLLLPSDVTVSNAQGNVSFKHVDQLSADDYIGDVGIETIETLKKLVEGSRMVVWNGPLGNYEKGFTDKTEQLAEAIAEHTQKTGAISLVGGGDTVASIQKLNLDEKFTFLSTAGGAMIDFLVEETLPGIEALTE